MTADPVGRHRRPAVVMARPTARPGMRPNRYPNHRTPAPRHLVSLGLDTARTGEHSCERSGRTHRGGPSWPRSCAATSTVTVGSCRPPRGSPTRCAETATTRTGTTTNGGRGRVPAVAKLGHRLGTAWALAVEGCRAGVAADPCARHLGAVTCAEPTRSSKGLAASSGSPARSLPSGRSLRPSKAQG